MKTSNLLLTLLTLLCSTSHGLERTRVDAEEQCTVSASGEEVCRNQDMNSREENNGSDASGIYYDDDDDEYDDQDVNDDKVSESQCVDEDHRCAGWAARGECNLNPNYMLRGCPVSCKSCPGDLKDGLTPAQHKEKPHLLELTKDFGVYQEVDPSNQQKSMFVIRKTIDYMKNFIYAEQPTHKLQKETMDACRNNDKLCSFWASIGECDNNPSFMVTKCAPSCLSCHKIDYNTRCGERDPKLQPGLKPGGLNLMFETIIENAPGNATDATQLAAAEKKVQDNGTPFYTVTVHSRPESASPKPDVNGIIPTNQAKDRKEAPWVITFDNFLTEDEAQYLIDMGYENGYKRSTDVGAKQVDGSFEEHKSQGRTSENSWCSSKTGCRQDPKVQRVMQRIADVTGIPTENYEDLQLLKYGVGQFYKAHHDYIGHQKDRHSGPRILTFFLYLSDVEEGGGTLLNNMGIEIKPKLGRALLWPSVLNADPSAMDGRTRHEALAVEKGKKFAANAWIHLYDNEQASKHGCN